MTEKRFKRRLKTRFSPQIGEIWSIRFPYETNEELCLLVDEVFIKEIRLIQTLRIKSKSIIWINLNQSLGGNENGNGRIIFLAKKS